MRRDLVLVLLGLAVGVGAGLLLGRRGGDPAGRVVECAEAGPVEERSTRASAPGLGGTESDRITRSPDEELEACQRALMTSWMNASHPIEVSERESSRDAARRFNESFYADDDPAQVEAHFDREGPGAAAERALEGRPLERGDVRVSCAPLPCVMEMDLTHPEGEEISREELDSAYWGVEGELGDAMMESLPGYGLRHTSVRTGSDPSQRVLRGIVTTHSEEDVEDLLQSMVLFAEEALGEKRFEE